MCYSRRLFNDHDTSSDPDEHYHHLWRDIVGTVVWFLAAGVATACGVGGGGIYVPLGIVLLGFSPKPASGLSQASIFGASLGGLLLNLTAIHPNGRIRNVDCRRDGEGRVILPEEDEEDGGGTGGEEGRTYTRPLVDYDMALFLAPMEMAGAVMGKLIQTIMPDWLYLLLASVILGFTCLKTYRKFLDARGKERQELKAREEREERRRDEREKGKGTEDDAVKEQAGGEDVS